MATKSQALVMQAQPDRVVGTMKVGAFDKPVTEAELGRAASRALSGEVKITAKAHRYASAVADGLAALHEIPDAMRLDVLIVLRAQGKLPKVAKPDNGKGKAKAPKPAAPAPAPAADKPADASK